MVYKILQSGRLSYISETRNFNERFKAGEAMHAIKTRLKIFLIIFVALMVTGTLGFMIIENRTFTDSAYFMIVTMATVGYGDIHPVTQAGKFFTIFLIITGVGTFLGVIANVTEFTLARREFNGRMEKLNMLIGLFFSEVGLYLMSSFSDYDEGFERIRPSLIITAKWNDQHFDTVIRNLRGYQFKADKERLGLVSLRTFLFKSRDFLVRLLENPVLLEHQSFTDLLRAVFHLTEELTYRGDVTHLPAADQAHLAGDIKRVYDLLIIEWLDYMKYLKKNYPFLFSLALRTNPFDRSASIIVTED